MTTVSNTRQPLQEHLIQRLDLFPKTALLSSALVAVAGALTVYSATRSNFEGAVQSLLIAGGAAASAVGTSLLSAVINRWKHIPLSLFAVPLLSRIGIEWHQGMGRKVYEERSCPFGKRNIGSLSYEKDSQNHLMPVLTLETEDPFEMGYCQGYLQGKVINDIAKRVLKPMMSLASIATGDFSGSYFNKQASQIRIDEPYATEIKGILAGMQEYARLAKVSVDIDEQTLRKAHMFADIYKAIACQKIFGISAWNVFGCSTAVIQKDGNTFVGRTLDWPSLGLVGEYAFVKRYSVKNTKIECHTYPGIVSVFTGKKEGFAVIVNENSTTSKLGVPYGLLARRVLEECNRVKDAQDLIDSLSAEERPASSFHLTVVDQRNALNFQFYPDPATYYVPRTLNGPADCKTLVVTNHTVLPDGTAIEKTICDATSKKRFSDMTKTVMRALSSPASLRDTMVRALKSVNNTETCSAILYDARDSHMQAEYVWDNHFAATHLNLST